MKRLNLIPTRRIVAKHRRRRIRRWAVACTMYALALVGTCLGLGTSTGSTNEALAENIADVEARINQTQQLIRDTEAGHRDAQANLDANREISSLPDWSILLSLLAKHLGDDVVLTACRVAPQIQMQGAARAFKPKGEVAGAQAAPAVASPDARSYALHIEGKGRSQSAVSRYVLRLEELKLFAKVKLVDTRREPFLSNEAIAFRLNCILDAQAGRDRHE